MKPERLGKIAKLLGGTLTVDEAGEVYARGISVDTRTIRPGEIFFALKGTRDGHQFVPQAFEKGAVAAVVSRRVDGVDLPQIVVDDTLKALGDLARAYRDSIAPKVVAITGSVGKTTTRRMIAAVLSEKFEVHSARKNFNNLIGLPLTLLDMPEGTRIAVVELGINQPGEMDRLIEIARPDVAVITHIAPVHTEGLGSVERIAQEKLKLARTLGENGVAVLNADSEYLREAAHTLKSRVMTYAIYSSADFRAEQIQFDDGKPVFRLNGLRVRLNMLGYPPIWSALAAFAVGNMFGIPPKICAEALEAVLPAPHRMELIRIGNLKILDDSYNSSPAALEQAFATMELLNPGRKVVVLGDMLELGDLAEQYHRQVADLVRRHRVDVAVLFGRLMAYAGEELKNYRGAVCASEDFDECISFLRDNLHPGDTVLVKGSHGMNMTRFVEAIEEWFGGEK